MESRNGNNVYRSNTKNINTVTRRKTNLYLSETCSYLNTTSYLIRFIYSCQVMVGLSLLVYLELFTRCNTMQSICSQKDALFFVAYEIEPNLRAVVPGTIEM